MNSFLSHEAETAIPYPTFLLYTGESLVLSIMCDYQVGFSDFSAVGVV